MFVFLLEHLHFRRFLTLHTKKITPRYCAKNTNYLVLQSCCLICNRKWLSSSPVWAVCHICRTSGTQLERLSPDLVKPGLAAPIGEAAGTRWFLRVRPGPRAALPTSLSKLKNCVLHTEWAHVPGTLSWWDLLHFGCKKVKGTLVLVCTQACFRVLML